MRRSKAGTLGVTAGVALTVLVLSGCTEDEPPATAAALPTARTNETCELLTWEEVADAVGGVVDEGVPSGPAACAWAGRTVSLSLTVTQADAGRCEGERSERASEVTELGVPAWWSTVEAGPLVGILVACPPEHSVTVTLAGGADEATMRSTATEIAQTALPRLG